MKTTQKILIICRHAKTEDFSLNDRYSKITQEGLQDTEALIKFFENCLIEDKITLNQTNTLFMSSIATRAIETIELVTRSLNIDSYEEYEELYTVGGSKSHFHWLEEKIVTAFEKYELVFIMAHSETGYFLSWLTKKSKLPSEKPRYNLFEGNKNVYEFQGLQESECFILDFKNFNRYRRITPNGICRSW